MLKVKNDLMEKVNLIKGRKDKVYPINLIELLEISIDIVNSLGYSPSKPIDHIGTTQRKRVWGYIKKYNNFKGEYFIIRIAEHHLEHSFEAVFQTVLHEVVHSIEGCFNHGEKFKRVLKEINQAYNLNCSVRGKSREDDPFKYRVYCGECKRFLLGRYRKSKLIKEIDFYKSNCCNSSLILEEC